MSDRVRSETYQSRWGFHPCDRDTLLNLKEYHRLMLRAFRQYRRWAAWDRKTVHRVGPEPAYFIDLTFNDGWSDRRQFLRFGPERRNLYHQVLSEYRAARTPKADAASVAPLDLPPGWEAQLEALRAWFTPDGMTG